MRLLGDAIPGKTRDAAREHAVLFRVPRNRWQHTRSPTTQQDTANVSGREDNDSRCFCARTGSCRRYPYYVLAHSTAQGEADTECVHVSIICWGTPPVGLSLELPINGVE